MKKNIFSKKVEKIFFEFNKKQAKIWNIGTNVYMTWYRLNKFLSQNNLNNIVEIKIKEVPNPDKDKKYKLKPTKYGIIKANGINITPAKGKKHFAWSEAGIRQFLQEGSAMNIVMYNENNSVFNNFKVTAEFNNIFGSNKIDQSWWLNKIKNLILNSLISCQKHIVNLGFTLFYVLVCKIYPNIFTNFKNNYVLSYCVGRSNTNKTWKIKSNESIKEANRMYSEKNTYKDLVDIILDNKDKENIFLQILDDVYNIIFSEDENDEIKNIAFDDLRLNEILRKLEEFRSHFRSELLTKRQKTNLKIIPIDLKNNGNNIMTPIEIVESAHIYECKKIKNEIISNFYNNSLDDQTKEKYYENIQNPQNGLLLNCNLHKAFDRRLFNFDINGKVVFNDENKEKIKILGIECAYIDPNIFDDEMKEFILKR